MKKNSLKWAVFFCRDSFFEKKRSKKYLWNKNLFDLKKKNEGLEGILFCPLS